MGFFFLRLTRNFNFMKIKNYLSLLVFLVVIVLACSPDDPDVELVPDRDRTEQQAEDLILLNEYLEAHYYNSEELSMLINASVTDIVITKLEDGETLPAGHTILANSSDLLSRTIVFEETTYQYFILKLNQGGGEASPRFTDKVRVAYEGSLTEDLSVFDGRIIQDFDLVGAGSGLGLIPGWPRVFPEFNVAQGFTTGADGVIYDNYGLGVMFLPSGLAYFSRGTVPGVPAYSNLVFKFALYQTE